MSSERWRIGSCWVVTAVLAGISGIIPTCRPEKNAGRSSLSFALTSEAPATSPVVETLAISLFRDMTPYSGVTSIYRNGDRDVVGTRLILELEGRRLTRFAKAGGSYLSSSDRRHLFGLGTAQWIDRLTVRWPSGHEQQWPGDQLPLGSYLRVEER